MVLARPRARSTTEINTKNSLYPQVFHRTIGGRVRKITAAEQFKPRNLETFDPVNQEYNRASPATIHTQGTPQDCSHTTISKVKQRTNSYQWSRR
jgi:hypothetical protein